MAKKRKTKPNAKPKKASEAVQFVTAWGKATEEQRRAFLGKIGIDAILAVMPIEMREQFSALVTLEIESEREANRPAMLDSDDDPEDSI